MLIWGMFFPTAHNPQANAIVLTRHHCVLLMAKMAKKSTVEKTIQQLIPQERGNYES
ncbi:peptide methionine sulfoxide reductase MsrB [Escherichia coli 1-176-05_S3_C2]|nr:peptide methionine sulfoxide reductase MsrB [Escherichia coli 1-176-05_S3_C2]